MFPEATGTTIPETTGMDRSSERGSSEPKSLQVLQVIDNPASSKELAFCGKEGREK